MSRPEHPPAYRPPWPFLMAALLAMVALYLTGRSTVLFLLGPLLLASRFTDARFEDRTWQVWLSRFVAVGLIVMTGNDRGFRGADTFITGRSMDWFGQYCAMELTLQCWIRRPVPPVAWLTVLSGVVFLAASNTLDTAYIRYLAPIYLVLAAAGMRALTERDRPRTMGSTPQVLAFGAGATLLGLVVGWVGFYTLWIWRGEITRWSNDLLFPDHSSEVGLSTSPKLGATRDLQGPLNRVLRVRPVGPEARGVDATHLRALAFYSYKNGEWGPTLEGRRFPAAAHMKRARSPEQPGLAVTRFSNHQGLLPAPLGVQSVAIEAVAELDLDSENGHAFRSIPEAPFEYELALVDPADRRSIQSPADKIERARCLEVPTELDPRVLAVASRIGNAAGLPGAGSSAAGTSTSEGERARALVRAVEQYLTTNHEYSLTTDPGEGDPVSNFITQKKSAHCEYFASAAVILLRCLGVPARYVSGYYAHEETSFGNTIVRQRDAHAWAEALVEGGGWVTVEATPSDGRPDATDAALPPWMRMNEWFQDGIDALRSGIVRSVGITGAVIIGISVIAFLVWRDIRRSQRNQPAPVYAYTIPADLAGVADEFDALLVRKGWRCPPDRTWHEHLAPLIDGTERVAPISEAFAPPVSPRLQERLRDFMGNYNRIRFGGSQTPENLRQLSALLADLEQEPWPQPEAPAGVVS